MSESVETARVKGRGTTKVGIVVSDSLDKTVTVKVVTPSQHRL